MKVPSPSWFEINNWVPIIGSAILVASSFFALSTKMALIAQRQDILIDEVKGMNQSYANIMTKLGNHENRLSVLETKVK